MKEPVTTSSDSTPTTACSNEPRSTDRYLAFMTGENAFAIPIRYVLELQDPRLIAPYLHPSPYDIGVLNFHGSPISVMDFRRILGMPPLPRAALPVVIILQKQTESGLVIGGCLVDQVLSISHLHQPTEQSMPSTAVANFPFRRSSSCA